MNKLSILTLFLLFISTNLMAFQVKHPVVDLLKKRDSQIKTIVNSSDSLDSDTRDKLSLLVNEIIDFDEMSKQALGSTYSEITTEKRTEFVDVFGTIVRDQSLKNLNIYKAEVTYDSVEIASDTVHVTTTAKINDVTTPVSYVMLNKPEKGWVVIDMAVDNVSTVDGYRRSFQRNISRKGFDSLLSSLKKRAARS